MNLQEVLDALSDIESDFGSDSELGEVECDNATEEMEAACLDSSSGEDSGQDEDEVGFEADEIQEVQVRRNSSSSTSRWNEVTSLTSPPERQYSSVPGPNLPDDGIEDPEDFFSLFFSEDVFDLIVHETNTYAHIVIENRTLTLRSRLRSWKDVTISEMKAFIAIILNMGIIKTSVLQDYWSTDITAHIPFFSQVVLLTM